MRALIVDDDFYARSFLEYILSPYASCDVCVDGEQAVLAFNQALQAGKPYDLVCLDLLMPVIDGPSALREIREVERDYGRGPENQVKVIITTVLEDAESTHDAMYLGNSTAFLQKPIVEDSLLAELKRLGLITGSQPVA